MVKRPPVFLRYSPNHSTRPFVPISLIVMHYTGMVSGTAALEWLCNPESKVSAHYLVEENGDIFQMVEEDRRAWHAGVSAWGTHTNINDVSIGIEVVNPGHTHGYQPFPAVQMEAVSALTQDIMQRHDIPAAGVVGHSDVAPSRKMDPGELFPWEWLAVQGVGIWHDVADSDIPLEPRELTTATVSQLQAFGYHMPDAPEASGYVIEAFQRHYRPSIVNGIWDADCQTRLEQLLLKSQY
jgi:N-acetylmuramoyl-L-alanine amidase